MLDTINGLPAHPLIAHVVAIMVLVTSLLAVLVVLWPAVRRRVGGAALFLAVGTLVAVPLTAGAGHWLQYNVMSSEIVMRHAGLGGQLVLWSALLTIAMIFWWGLHAPLFADDADTLPATVRRIGIAIAGTGTLLFAVISAWLVVRIGHTGAQAVWAG